MASLPLDVECLLTVKVSYCKYLSYNPPLLFIILSLLRNTFHFELCAFNITARRAGLLQRRLNRAKAFEKTQRNTERGILGGQTAVDEEGYGKRKGPGDYGGNDKKDLKLKYLTF